MPTPISRSMLIASLLVAAACRQKSSAPRPAAAVTLDAAIPGFLPANRARIDRFLAERGASSPTYDAAHRPVAVLDWDNTMMRNDIGDATFFWMLRHDAILQPPARDWSQTNANLTTAARAALNAACDSLAEPGQPLRTSSHPACADALVSIYDAEKTPNGAPAWEHATTATMHQSYAWGAQLQAGHTADEIRGFARAAYAENAAAPIGATQTVGTTRGLAAYVRVYEPMRDLARALREAGFSVWVVSASSQYLVEVVGEHAGFAPDHVIGIRATLGGDGRATYRLQGCGTEPDGADTIIPFDEGKRCWINRAIFGRAPTEQLARAASPSERPAFAAGDSDTDLAMLQDATELKLAIDRHRVMLMCNARSNARSDAGPRWLVQPMFIEPMPPHDAPYACGATLDHRGRVLTDEDGRPIADR